MSDLTRKLRRLGVVKGARELTGPPTPTPPPQDKALPPGQQVKTPLGFCFYVQERYPLDLLHGHSPLSVLLAHDQAAAARMAIPAQPEPFDLRRALFIDTETTGLSRGAGVLAFLIGAGYFEDDAFVLRQYFLRDPAEEPAALNHLAEWSEGFGGLVSFNGRGFDVPVLQNRFVLSRLRPNILKAPHLDLLSPARRVWRGRFESCRLGTLERHILGVQRSQADVMGWLIPELYRQYLRGGDNGEMRQVLYHNAVDILSLVVLAARLCHLFANPLADDVDARERAALARWFQALNRPQQAEAAYRAALDDFLPLDVQRACLAGLAALLKRQDRHAEAVPLWVQWALEDEGSVEAQVELAKFYEWRQVDLEKALAWTGQALGVVAGWPKGLRRDDVEAELHHRQARLERKLGKAKGLSSPQRRSE
ncbi:MAG: ribonuclease H-like domain-containing protein [Anaerolineae bacterium]|jgi:uncharacterized protein YprB with RNaseH-like and TPR domain